MDKIEKNMKQKDYLKKVAMEQFYSIECKQLEKEPNELWTNFKEQT